MKSASQRTSGKLYICGTPIGNLEDVTLRVLRILSQEVDLVAAEDTRQTLKLLNRHDIKLPLTSYHARNESAKRAELLKKLQGGARIALVSDAGMPGLSDPGYHLIKACVDQGIELEVLPGPSSVIAALVISGLPTQSFVYQGFLPRKAGERRKILEELAATGRTIALFESPRRIEGLLTEILELVGDRQAVLARELTKKFEQVIRGTVGELLQIVRETSPRGEMVLMLGPPPETKRQAVAKGDLEKAVRQKIQAGLTKKEAISEVAVRFKVPKRQVYEAVKEVHVE